MTTIMMPAWIRKHDAEGVWAVLGSEPPLDAKEVFFQSRRSSRW